VNGFSRFPEIDAARGAAVVAMLLFNWQFALAFYGFYSFDVYSGFWFWFARVVGAAFLFIAGASLWLSLSLRRKSESEALLHAAKIFCLGLAITAVTWLVIPRGFVAFGILHCIGLSLLLAIPLVQVKPKILVFLGLTVIAAGVVLNDLTFSFTWLLWLGFVPTGFHSIDFFPLAPWFGFALLGVAFAKKFYDKAKESAVNQKPDGKTGWTRVITGGLRFLGRHSLAVYLLHQPVLLAALLFAGTRPAGLNLFGLV